MISIPCDYCGNDDYKIIYKTKDTNYHFLGEFEIVACRICNLVYLNPRPINIGNYYPGKEYQCFKNERETTRLGSDHHFVVANKEIGLAGNRLCDIGCGVGDFLLAAKGSGWQITGIEPNEYACSRGNTRLGEGSVFKTIAEVFNAKKRFEAITMWHVFEHLPSPGKTLGQIHNLLEDGGLLGIAVPNFDSLERRIWGKNWIAIMAPTHLYHFTLPTLSRHLERSGFVVRKVIYQTGVESLAANILRTLRRTLLDPFARGQKARILHPDFQRKDTPQLRNEEGYYKIDKNRKMDVAIKTRRILYPLAWTISKANLGPELLIYATKS